MKKQAVIVEPETNTLYVPHLGFTLRVLLAAAASYSTPRRVWKVRYKGTVIGSVRIKDFQ